MSNTEAFQVLRPDAQETLAGIRVLVGDQSALLANFLEYARQHNIDLTRQVQVLSGTQITGMCLWVPSPGKTALLFTPRLDPGLPVTEPAVAAAVTQAVADARHAGIVLVQAMVEPGDTRAAALLTGVGLHPLAKLIYMERQPPLLAPSLDFSPPLRLEPYSAATHALFRRAILDSYQQTRDCPELSGLRAVDDVIAGHQAVGQFDPALWSVVLDGTAPVGCLLLAHVPARHALELVYLGLCPAARRRGLGRRLMHRVLAIGARRHFDVLTLAVDAANQPALALYRRCGYRRVAERVALIQTL